MLIHGENETYCSAKYSFVISNKEIGLDVNPEQTVCQFCFSRSEYRIKSQYKANYKFFEITKEFKYFGKILTDPNSIQEEIKIRLKSGNICYLSVKNIWSYCLRVLSKYI